MMINVKKQNTRRHGKKIILVLAASVGSLAIPACQTPRPSQENNAYGNPGQTDPYNPYYGQPQGSQQGGYASNSSYPATGTASYGQNGVWVEDVSDQDAFNPPPQQPGASSHNPPPTAKPRTHVVQRGDTLWRLSKQYGTTVNAIKSANSIPSHSNTIVAGSTITIPY